MKTKSAACWTSALAVVALLAGAQTPQILALQEPQKVSVPRQGEAKLALKLSMRPGYHANSDRPSEDFLIPMRLTWDAKAPVEAVEVVYPKAKLEKFEFNEKPISVVDGEFEIVTRLRRAPNAMPGPAFLSGKLRYQACNDKMCFPPKTIDVKVPLLIQ